MVKKLEVGDVVQVPTVFGKNKYVVIVLLENGYATAAPFLKKKDKGSKTEIQTENGHWVSKNLHTFEATSLEGIDVVEILTEYEMSVIGSVLRFPTPKK